MSDAEKLQEVLESFEGGKKWIKGMWFCRNEMDQNKMDYYCLAGGLILGYGLNPASYVNEAPELPCTSVIAEIIGEQFPERAFGNVGIHAITGFNDHEDTTFDDIRMVLEKAIVKEQEKL